MKQKPGKEYVRSEVERCLNEKEWFCFYRPETERIYFNLHVGDAIKSLEFTVLLGDDNVVVLADCPIGVETSDEEMMQRMALFLTRANYGLRVGGFDFDMDSGKIRYRIYCRCEVGASLNGALKEAFTTAVAMYSRCGKGIIDILYRGKTDKEAAETCEHESTGMLERLKRLLAEAKEREAKAAADDGSSEEN